MSKKHRILKPRFWLILTMLSVMVTACVMGSQARFLREQNDDLTRLEAEYDRLMEQKIALERELEFRNTDEWVIRQARENMGMLMPGEILFDDAE